MCTQAQKVHVQACTEMTQKAQNGKCEAQPWRTGPNGPRPWLWRHQIPLQWDNPPTETPILLHVGCTQDNQGHGKGQNCFMIQHFLVEIWCFTSVGLPHRNSTGVTIENDREPSVTNISTGKHALTPQSHSWHYMVSISILCSRAVKELSSTLTPHTNVKAEMTMGQKVVTADTY